MPFPPAVTRFALAFLAATAVAGATACGRIAGIDEYAVSEPDSGAAEVVGTCGAFTYGTDGRACRDCIDADQLACDTAKSCLSDGTCRSKWDCFLGCRLGDAECRGRCASGNPLSIGSPSNADFVNAIYSSCSKPCRLGGSSEFTSGCNACLEASCDVGLNEDLDALRYLACAFNSLENPNDPADPDRCESQPFAAGKTKYEEARDCFIKSCRDQCMVGPDFSCAGHVSWPFGSDGPITLRAVFEDVVGGNFVGLPNVSVRACGTPDQTLECDPVADVQPRTSDSGGSVVLEFARTMLSGDYFAYLEATLEDGEQWLYYELPPPRRTGARHFGLNPGTIATITDPTRGLLLVWAQQCTHANGPLPSSGVVVKVPTGDALVVYLRDLVPDSNLSATDSFGLASIVLKPGFHTVQAEYGDELVAEWSNVIVREQTVTLLRLPPTPLP